MSAEAKHIAIPTRDGVVVDVYRTADHGHGNGNGNGNVDGSGSGDGRGDGGPAVIVCHGFIQNRFAFESDTRSMLAHLRSMGLVVYVVELRGRTGVTASSRTAAGLHEYTDVDAAAVVDWVAARHTSVAWIGHSMGGLVGALLPASSRDRVAAVITIGAPLFAGRKEVRRLMAPARSVAAARFAHARGFTFEGRRWSGLLYAMRRALDQPRVPMPMRIWAPGSLDEAALAFTLKRSFADDSWAVFADMLELVATDADRAGFVAAGVRLKQFERPILVVAGAHDDLAPPEGARPLYERVGTRDADREYLELRAGHIDMLIGDRAPDDVWRPMAAFLTRHMRLR